MEWMNSRKKANMDDDQEIHDDLIGIDLFLL